MFVTNGIGEERLVARKAFPLGWTPRGVLSALMARSHVSLRVWRVDGEPAAPPRTLQVSASAWDWSTSRFYAISHGRLIRTDGISVTKLAQLRTLGFARPSLIQLSPLGHGLVEVASSSRLVVVDSSGHARFDALLPAGWRLDGALAAEANGTITYEATQSSSQPARHFRLYAALPGARPRLLDTYTVAPACAPHALSLRGSAVLLYASPGLARLYDARTSQPPSDLSPAIRWLRARHRTGQPSLA